MRNVFILATAFLLVSGSALAGSSTVRGEVRSSTGKLLYKTKTEGNRTEVRDSSGRLLNRSKTSNSTTEVRSPSGKLLRRIREK
jgi:hypothetical protein